MIDSLRLQHFRSYHDAAFEFEAGVNIIVGPNASGKTNLLEALLVACRAGSFRAKDAELIRIVSQWARLDLLGPSTRRTVKIVNDNQKTQKTFNIDGKSFKRLPLAKTAPVVLFEPNHLLLLHGSPERRRDYMDDLLEQCTPGYTKVRRDYRRTLAQRNALLKHGFAVKSQLFAWNVRLSELGAVLASERYNLAERINSKLNDLYETLSQSKQARVAIKYTAIHNIDTYSSALLRALEERQSVDIERGFTSTGPHREDFLIEFNGRDAAEVASRGETRTVLLAMKILELEMLEQVRNQKPLLLLDDVFSELDGTRRKALTEVLQTHQTFITTTDADIILHHFTDNCRIIALGKD